MDEDMCIGCRESDGTIETCMMECPLDICDDCGLNPCSCGEIDEEWSE